MNKDIYGEKISVIIPVHNGEKWIRKTVKRILNQTYKNVEIILVENNSKDNSWEICQKLEKNFETIKAYKSFERGTSLARKKGVLEATGEYIIFSDQDDSFLNGNCISNMRKSIVDDEAQVVQFGYWKKYIGNIKREIVLTDKNQIFTRKEFYENELAGIFGVSKSSFTPTVWTKIYKAAILKEAVKNMSESLFFAEDCYLNCLFFSEKDVQRVSVRKEAYYVWNVGVGFSATNNSGQVLFDELKFIKPLQIRLLEENFCDEKIIFSCHLEVLYFMLAIIIQMIEERISRKIVETKIAELYQYDIVQNAITYFKNQTIKKNWEDIEIIISDILPEEYYDWCLEKKVSYWSWRYIRKRLLQLIKSFK